MNMTRYLLSCLCFSVGCLAVPIIAAAEGADLKQPNVAGAFYSADPNLLSEHIDYLKQSAGPVPANRKVAMIIAPHAGYVYSGGVAAYAYKAIARNQYTTIIVIAPSHFLSFEGVSIWAKGAFKTPLGTLEVDAGFAGALLKENADFKEELRAFDKEHALEVQLPFIQKTFGAVKIVPILMGQPNLGVGRALAEALDKLIGARDDVLIVISSDMSHYHDYDTANRMDAGTLKVMMAKDAPAVFNGCLLGQMELCGLMPVTTALYYAQQRGLTAGLLKYANSGDTAGDKSRVVGYASVIFYSGDLPTATERIQDDLSDAHKKELLAIARGAVDSFVTTGKLPAFNVKDERLLKVQGAFVTLHKDGQLRGCIGHIIGQEPLWQTVRDVAVSAASQDPRFKPVTADELSEIQVEVSVLSVPVRVRGADEIVLGRDGVIISDGKGHQGVFLPQVADETGWSKEEFLSQLASQKAGLSPDAWKNPDVELYAFTANVFHE